MLAGQALDAVVAAADRVGDRATRAGRFGGAQRIGDGGEVGGERVEHVDDRRRVGAEDLHPQFGGGCRDPRRVAHALAGEPQRAVRRVDEAAGEQARDELRHVRDERDRAVVLFGRHLERRGAEVEREALDEGEVGGGGLLVAAHDPGAPDEDVGARGDRSAALAAGERVRADVVGEVDAALAQRAQRLELDARDVGHDGVADAAPARAR